MVLAVLMIVVPLVTVERLVDPVTFQPHWLDVTGTVLLWPLLLGVLWWVWRVMELMRLTPRMPLAWQLMGAAMFLLIRGAVLLGVLSAGMGLVRVGMALHAHDRIPEDLVTFGVSVLIGVGATYLLDDSTTKQSGVQN